MSAQGQVLLTWSSSPLALLYYINRSVDNITFTNIGSTALVQYNDITAVVGTIYYYTVQAATLLISSPPTFSVTGQALNPGQTTVGNLRLECQQRTDRVTSDNISIQEWNSMISQSYKELYDILLQKFGNDYYVQIPYSFQTTGQIDPITQAQTFPLPADFYKLLRAEVSLNPSDPNAWITIREFDAIQANLYNYPNVYTLFGTTNLKYRLWGTNIQIVPITTAGQTIRLWYSPRPNQLIKDTDTVDAISGWEEYIVADCCIKAMTKTEEDPQIFMAQKQGLLKRIEEAAENRNVGEAPRVSDSRRRNFAWSDDYGERGGGMW
jgi:hypothetical protein